MINHFFITSFFLSNSWYFIFFVLAWVISYVCFPVIINISNAKGLMATPNSRSSHSVEIPNLGGVGIFIGFILAFITFRALFGIDANNNVSGSLIVLFFLGLKDDILILTARTKFIVQVGVGLIMTLNSNATIDNLFGIFDVYQMGIVPTVALTAFAYVLIINSYNLIDGIDGLAGTIAICILFISSVVFYNSNAIQLLVVCLTLMGAIVAFLQYNFSKKKKIFMGDTGSMIIGFLICFIVINVLNLKKISFGLFSFKPNLAFISALLFYPLIDTARIFFVRLFIIKKSPFKADKNHIHHRLLAFGFKHYQISIFAGLVTLVLTFFSVLIVDLNIYEQIILVLFLGTFLISLPFIWHKLSFITFIFIRKGILIVTALLSLSFTQSCASKKDILYLQDNSNTAINDTKIIDQKIEPNDILSIKIYSLDPETSRVYNIDLLENTSATNSLEMIKVKGYLVTDQGDINMPILGNITVNNKTTKELELYLKKKLVDEGHLKEPTVSIRILNAKITVLGEVKAPGTFDFYEKNITLLQAIGLAGDLTINGERKDVLLIRQENNTKIIHHINLTTKDWMSTDLYYIKQNDVIIVNPNKARIKSSGIIGNPGTFISIMSFLLTSFLLIKK